MRSTVNDPMGISKVLLSLAQFLRRSHPLSGNGAAKHAEQRIKRLEQQARRTGVRLEPRD